MHARAATSENGSCWVTLCCACSQGHKPAGRFSSLKFSFFGTHSYQFPLECTMRQVPAWASFPTRCMPASTTCKRVTGMSKLTGSTHTHNRRKRAWYLVPSCDHSWYHHNAVLTRQTTCSNTCSTVSSGAPRDSFCTSCRTSAELVIWEPANHTVADLRGPNQQTGKCLRRLITGGVATYSGQRAFTRMCRLCRDGLTDRTNCTRPALLAE